MIFVDVAVHNQVKLATIKMTIPVVKTLRIHDRPGGYNSDLAHEEPGLQTPLKEAFIPNHFQMTSYLCSFQI